MINKEPVKIIEECLIENKGENVVVLDIREKTPIANYLILCSSTNKRQLKALCDHVEDECAKHKIAIKNIEGKPETGWMLIDAYDIIINIFSEEERERISLESLYNK